MTTIVEFDPYRYDFAALVRDALGGSDLEQLHAGATGRSDWSIYRTMEDAPAHRAYREVVDGNAFAALYTQFVREVVAPLFAVPIRVQAAPTPRIVFADQTGEPRFHRDRDYGHDPRETNFQVVLTPSVATNAMWIETAPGAGDHAPAALTPGQMLMFDGANLSHGAVSNATGRSRVSFDFRSIAEADAGERHRVEPPRGRSPGPHDFVPFE